MFLYDYFLGAAHPSLSVAKLWSASEVRKLGAWEGALPLPFPQALFKGLDPKLLIFARCFVILTLALILTFYINLFLNNLPVPGISGNRFLRQIYGYFFFRWQNRINKSPAISSATGSRYPSHPGQTDSPATRIDVGPSAPPITDSVLSYIESRCKSVIRNGSIPPPTSSPSAT